MFDRKTTHPDAELRTIDETPCQKLTTTLSVAARTAYELFSDVSRIPEWLSVIRSARVLSRCDRGRATRAAFVAGLERASMGYTLDYNYSEAEFRLAWATCNRVSTRISGSAVFQPLGDRACMMHYQLSMESEFALPAWDDPMFNGHPPSAVLADFREFVERSKYLAA